MLCHCFCFGLELRWFSCKISLRRTSLFSIHPKCEICVFWSQALLSTPNFGDHPIPVRKEVKCLGFVWKGNLSASSITIARGSEWEHRCFSSICGWSFYHWICTSVLSMAVRPGVYQEILLGELSKRVQKYPMWFCNMSARIAFDEGYILSGLVCKLCFLLDDSARVILWIFRVLKPC